MAKKLVILDAGHAAATGGKRAPDGSLLEWEFNNNMQYRLKKRLEQLGFMVYLVNPTPEKGADKSLANRCKDANNYWAAQGKPNCLYVSLHANASGSTWSNARGVEVFTSKGCSARSSSAAKKICNAIYKDVYAVDKGFKNRGHKTNNFYVVKYTNMPACLIEYEFYTNKDGVNLLKNKRTLLCEATLKGICEHFGVAYKMSVDITNEKENEGKLPSTSKPWKNGTYNAKVKVIAKDGLNVRRGRPGTDKYNSKLGVLPEGAVVEVGYCLNGWFGIIYNGQQGFISGDYVKLA